jgi:acetylornithine deacetylase/succinyl-diaminopimelate desuccinylase-like protein
MPGSDPYERVLKAVDDVRDEMVDFLRQIVRIDTTVPPGNNYPECAELLRSMMARAGIRGATRSGARRLCQRSHARARHPSTP